MPSTVIFDNPVSHSIFSGWDVVWASLQPIESKDVLTFIFSLITIIVAFKAFNLQRESSEKMARMEMAKVLTEAFSHSEMFDAIEYFLKVFPHLVDENGKDRKEYIELIQNAPESKRYHYRLLTTLHHAERLYKTEKADKTLFTSLITPDLVEVALCLYKLDGFVHGVDKPVYEMVYKVFEDIRTSYLEPFWHALNNKTSIDDKQVKKTRLVIKSLQTWDRKWGDEGDRLLTEKDLILLDYVENISLDKRKDEAILKQTEAQLKDLIDRFSTYRQKVSKLKHLKSLSELYFFRGVTRGTLRQYKEAIKDYTKAIKLNPQYANAYNNRGVTHANLKYTDKKQKEAIDDFTKSIKLNPQYAIAFRNRGNVKFSLAKYNEAIKDYNKVIEFGLQHLETYTIQENVTTIVENLFRHSVNYKKSIEFDSRNLYVYVLRGVAKCELKQDEEAIDDFNQAIEINPQYDLAYSCRAQTYQEMAQQARDKGNNIEAEELEAKAQADFAEYRRLKGLEQ